MLKDTPPPHTHTHPPRHLRTPLLLSYLAPLSLCAFLLCPQATLPASPHFSVPVLSVPLTFSRDFFGGRGVFCLSSPVSPFVYARLVPLLPLTLRPLKWPPRPVCLSISFCPSLPLSLTRLPHLSSSASSVCLPSHAHSAHTPLSVWVYVCASFYDLSFPLCLPSGGLCLFPWHPGLEAPRLLFSPTPTPSHVMGGGARGQSPCSLCLIEGSASPQLTG